ncbi:MAG TPA: tetratricopeptide repeat protein [Bryobacteraceae bacterium]|nr:tetratricopeptide repeat protein [Bryobacteraceae bacterium]
MWLIAALLFFQGAGADGMKALQDGRYDAAAEAFTKAIAADPGDYTAHFNLALAYSFLNRDAEGIAEYRKALELKPGLYQAQLNAGILLLRQKQPAEALPLLEAASAQRPSEFRPRLYVAEAQLAMGDAAKAEQSYRAALESDGKSAGAHLGIARALARQGKLADAAPHFRQAAELDPQYRDALLELAGLYENDKQYAEAIALYRQFPGNPAAEEHLGALLIQTKQYGDAIPQLEKAYGQSPTPANRAGLAAAYVFSNQAAKAAPLLDRAVADEPANYDLRLMYARALRDQKQYAGAARQFTEATKLKPDAGPVWDELGGVLYLAGDYPAALTALDRARQLGENGAGNVFFRALALDRLHQVKPALEAYQEFLSMSQGKNPDQEFQARQRAKLLQKELDKR